MPEPAPNYIERGAGGDALGGGGYAPTVVNPAPTPAPVVAPRTAVVPAVPATNIPSRDAQIEEIKKGIAEAQKMADAIAAKMKTDASNITSSSAPVVAAENKTKTDVAALSPVDTKGLEDASANYLKELESQRIALENRRKEEVARIEKDFETQKVATEKAQEKETGTFNVSLQRIGGYLGNSISSLGAQLNLADTHRAEIQTLMQKKESAIAQANNAIDDKQFALARLKVQEVKDVEKEIDDRKNKFFEQNLKLVQESRQQDEYERKKVKDQLENLAYIDPSTIDPSSLKQIDDFYGVPGFAKNFLDVQSNLKSAKSEKDWADARKATLEFLQNIPAGQDITFPDGTTYTGLGKAGDVSSFLQVDNAGIGHIINHNKLTGKTSISTVGPVGKTKGGGSSPSSVDPVVRDNAVATFQMRLEDSKDKNGFYDPDIYVKERKMLKEAYPQLVSYMDKLFLKDETGNGFFSTDAISRLRKKGIYYGDTSIADSVDTPDAVVNEQ